MLDAGELRPALPAGGADLYAQAEPLRKCDVSSGGPRRWADGGCAQQQGCAGLLHALCRARQQPALVRGAQATAGRESGLVVCRRQRLGGPGLRAGLRRRLRQRVRRELHDAVGVRAGARGLLAQVHMAVRALCAGLLAARGAARARAPLLCVVDSDGRRGRSLRDPASRRHKRGRDPRRLGRARGLLPE